MSYRMLAGPGEIELVIKKSRFIGRARPISTESEAQSFLASLHKQYWEASHHCYAYVLGQHDEVQRSSDAGEPAGAAGRPILETIKKVAIKNAIVVVTRYFGGVLLGAGGLTRAYGQSATAALQAAGVQLMLPHRHYTIVAAYHWHGKLVHDLQDHGLSILSSHFAEGVTLDVLVPVEREPDFVIRLRDLTNGQVELTAGEETEVGVAG